MLPPPFYEPYWTDKKMIQKQISQGKLLSGRLFYDPAVNPKNYGFVYPDPVESEDGESRI